MSPSAAPAAVPRGRRPRRHLQSTPLRRRHPPKWLVLTSHQKSVGRRAPAPPRDGARRTSTASGTTERARAPRLQNPSWTTKSPARCSRARGRSIAVRGISVARAQPRRGAARAARRTATPGTVRSSATRLSTASRDSTNCHPASARTRSSNAGGRSKTKGRRGSSSACWRCPDSPRSEHRPRRRAYRNAAKWLFSERTSGTIAILIQAVVGGDEQDLGASDDVVAGDVRHRRKQ